MNAYKIGALSAVIGLTAILCLTTAFTGIQSGTTVIVGGTLIDGAGGAPVPDAVVVLRGNRITAAGKRASVKYPNDAKMINAEGKYILPGLIDEHVHYAEWMGELFLAHGVTTVKDTGNPVEWLSALDKAINAGQTAGPRLFYTGNSLTSRAAPTKDHHLGLKDDAMARAAVKILHRQGAAAGKVHQQITPELLRAVVEESHRLGMPVTGHLRRIGAREAALAGIDGLEHSSGIPRSTGPNPDLLKTDDPENDLVGYYDDLNEAAEMREENFGSLIKLLVDKKVAIIPTLITWFRIASDRRAEFARDDARYADEPGLSYVPRGIRALWKTSELYEPPNTEADARFRTAYSKMSVFLKRFHEAGGRLYAGSAQTVAVPGRSLHHELEMMVELGLKPADVIEMATRRNAEFLGKGSELGVIAAGKLADIIILDRDPLADIKNINSISAVIKDGRILDARYNPDYAMPIPRPKVTRPTWLERELEKVGMR
ncbi:MAG: amidohydrolase family protein [Acidobacteria bacterium]|nr:amidohydrolase family protein [Acidobacteriota bacterium]